MGQIAAIIAVIAIVAFCVYLIVNPFLRYVASKKKISPMVAKNIKREKDLLAKIIKDIRENTDAWFLHDRVGMGHLLANNTKCMGIVYQSTDNLTILLNLKAVTDFKEHEENTVKISIRGDHAKKFLTEAEQLIDKRGNELRFFGDEFDKRI